MLLTSSNPLAEGPHELLGAPPGCLDRHDQRPGLGMHQVVGTGRAGAGQLRQVRPAGKRARPVAGVHAQHHWLPLGHCPAQRRQRRYQHFTIHPRHVGANREDAPPVRPLGQRLRGAADRIDRAGVACFCCIGPGDQAVLGHQHAGRIGPLADSHGNLLAQ